MLALYERMQYNYRQVREKRRRADEDRKRREALKHQDGPQLTEEEKAAARMKALASRREGGPRRRSLEEEPKKDQDQTPLLMYMSRGFGEPEDRCNPRSPSPTTKKKKFFSEDRPSFDESEDEDEDMQQVRIKRKCSTALLNMSLNKKMSPQCRNRAAWRCDLAAPVV